MRDMKSRFTWLKFLKNEHLYRDLLNTAVKNATMSQEKRSEYNYSTECSEINSSNKRMSLVQFYIFCLIPASNITSPIVRHCTDKT